MSFRYLSQYWISLNNRKRNGVDRCSQDDDEDSEEDDETSNTSMSTPSTSISLLLAVYVLTLVNLSQSPF